MMATLTLVFDGSAAIVKGSIAIWPATNLVRICRRQRDEAYECLADLRSTGRATAYSRGHAF
jgi:hypothetical protein